MFETKPRRAWVQEHPSLVPRRVFHLNLIEHALLVRGARRSLTHSAFGWWTAERKQDQTAKEATAQLPMTKSIHGVTINIHPSPLILMRFVIFIYLFLIQCCGSVFVLWCVISGWISPEQLKGRRRPREAERQVPSIQSQPCHFASIFRLLFLPAFYLIHVHRSTTKISLSHQFIFLWQDPRTVCVCGVFKHQYIFWLWNSREIQNRLLVKRNIVLLKYTVALESKSTFRGFRCEHGSRKLIDQLVCSKTTTQLTFGMCSTSMDHKNK